MTFVLRRCPSHSLCAATFLSVCTVPCRPDVSFRAHLKFALAVEDREPMLEALPLRAVDTGGAPRSRSNG